MTKKQLIKQLRENVFCRIRPSQINGVGVFAIKDIPKGTNIFKGSCNHNLISLGKKDIKTLNPEVKKIIKDFFIGRNGKVLVPTCAMNGIDISYYLNHSKTPNIKAGTNGEVFVSRRNIKKNEELTIDYEKDYSEKFDAG